MELKDIKIIIDLMKKNDLSVFEMEKEGFKIKLKKGFGPAEGYASGGLPVPIYQPPPAPAAPTPAATPPAGTPAITPPSAPRGPEITSPMVGTFYASMSPDSPPYVKVGQSVTPDTVVCIVEAMKVMNEIKPSQCGITQAGVVAEILVENGKPVEFGQPLFRLQ